MISVRGKPCLRDTHPDWLDVLVAAIEAVSDKIFFDQHGKPVKDKEVKAFDEMIYDALSHRFCGLGKVERNTRLWYPERRFDIDLVLPTSPRTLIEIEKGQLPRLELDIVKIMSAILDRPDEYGYGCLVVPVNYIDLTLAPRQTPYQYVTEHLLPLARPLLDIRNSAGGYFLREFCVAGYWDPRGGEDMEVKRPFPGLGTLQKPYTPYSHSLVSESRRHQGKPYMYWWDITPSKRAHLEQVGQIVLRKKDSGEQCAVRSQQLLPLLTTDRQTSRKGSPWALKVFANRPNEIAIEPGPRGDEGWAYLPIRWVA